MRWKTGSGVDPRNDLKGQSLGGGFLNIIRIH